MDKIASKLDYLKGLLKGMELNGAKKNVIVEEIIEILDLMNKELLAREFEPSLPFIQNKSGDYDYFNDKTMRRSDFRQANDTADIWYDESINMARQAEHSVYKNSQKVVVEKICKHCGTYIRAEFSLDEYEKVKIQCPKCKHFMLPEAINQEVYKDKTFNWDEEPTSEFEEYSFQDIAREAEIELKISKDKKNDIYDTYNKHDINSEQERHESIQQTDAKTDSIDQLFQPFRDKQLSEELKRQEKDTTASMKEDVAQTRPEDVESFVVEEHTQSNEDIYHDEDEQIESSITQVEDEILFNEFEIETDVFIPDKELQVIKNVNDIEGEGFFKRFFKN